MHGSGAFQALRGALQGLDAPHGDLVQEHVEGRFVELDHVDAVGLQRFGFLVQELGKGERHLDAVAVVAVGDGVDDGHRPGQGEFQLPPGMRAGDARLVGMHAAFQLQRRHHLRDHRLVAVLADAHLDPVGEVDAVDLFQKAVHEVLPRLFALGEDIDAGVFLYLYRQQRGVALGAGKLVALGLPWRPQHVRLGQPFRLRQGACDGGWKQHGSLPESMV